ncbi:uncharacterized protein miip [Salminus brasiliensis]|uniref:uncharacterized protein miip n=1 Tax=Salminus brasiliensis TaxID=930266 RepID=UPI003B832500
MISLDHLEALRKQNKELLIKLRQQSLKLASQQQQQQQQQQQPPESSEAPVVTTLTADVDASQAVNARERNQGTLNVRNGADPVVTTVAVGERRPHAAREALCKPRSQKRAAAPGKKPACFAAEALMPAGHVTGQNQPSEDAPYTTLLQHQGNNRCPAQIATKAQMQPKPVLLTQDRVQRGLDRVTFLSPGQDLESTSERQRMQPLLGYDWIAGLLDAESSLTERSEQFFSELHSFRQVNKDECVHSPSSGLPVIADPWFSSAEEDVTDQEHAPDTHQCTFCYRINGRLFAAPLDPQAACPICKMPETKHPHTEQEPAFIRISIPRSTLLPAYQYRARHRCSFEPSDSLSLPSHCLSGWSNSNLKIGSRMSSLDLRSSLVNRPDTGLVPSALPEGQLDVSVSRAAGGQRSDQLLDVSRLARYRFQHLGPARTKANKSA